MKTLIQLIVQVAGLAQVALVTGSLFVPTVLNWRAELSKVQPLIKQMFWTYAGYIVVINLCFGLISLFCSNDLINGTTLATLITGFIAAYWISRVLVQFLYFDRSNFPKSNWNKLAEVILVILFICLSAVYCWACFYNYTR